MSAQALLGEAARLHDAGELDRAAGLYAQVLQAQPRSARVHYLLGLLEMRRGDLERAQSHLDTSLAIDPAQGEAWRALGELAGRTGRLQAATSALRSAVACDRNSALTWFQLGMALDQCGEAQQAAKAYRRAIRLKPVFPEAWCNLGNSLRKLGEADGAEDALRKAIAQRSGFAEAWCNLGVLLEHDRKDTNAALASQERALEWQPDLVPALFARAALLGRLGRTVDAVEAYERLLAVEPRHADGYNNLGVIFLGEAMLPEAQACFERALEIDAGHVDAMNNLGNTLLRVRRFDAALAAFENALALRPQFAEALNGAGLALQELGCAERALQCYEQALVLRPGFAEATANLAMVNKQLGRIEAARAGFERAAYLSGNPTLRLSAALAVAPIMGTEAQLEAEAAAIDAALAELAAQPWRASLEQLAAFIDPPFYLAYRGWNNAPRLARTVELLRRNVTDLAFAAPHVAAPRGDGPVRVGFVSSYFYNHSVGVSFERLLGALARDPRLELVGIALSGPDDELTARIRAHCARWVCAPGSLRRARETIAALELDVLYFTDVGMDRITWPLSMMRLARVQCVSGGHPETTGSDQIDVMLSSRWLEEPSAQAFYTEKLLLLDAYNTELTRPPIAAERFPRADLLRDVATFPGTAAGVHLYLVPVKLQKLHPQFERMLARLLQRDPHGHVVLFADERQQHWLEATQARQRQTMGDVAQRVHFAPWANAGRFASWMTAADAVLDCWPFGMGTTAILACTLGVPVVTLPGPRLSGRGTQALLRMIGVEWPIAADAEQWVDKAIELASVPAVRRRLAQDLAAQSDLLFDENACADETASFLIDSVLKQEIA